MPILTANATTKAELDDLHTGVHKALEALVNKKDYSDAERILRLVDQLLTRLINNIQVTRP